MSHTAELQEVSSFYPTATSHCLVKRQGHFSLWRTLRQQIEPEKIDRAPFYTILEDGSAVAVAISEQNVQAQWDFHIGHN